MIGAEIALGENVAEQHRIPKTRDLPIRLGPARILLKPEDATVALGVVVPERLRQRRLAERREIARRERRGLGAHRLRKRRRAESNGGEEKEPRPGEPSPG